MKKLLNFSAVLIFKLSLKVGYVNFWKILINIHTIAGCVTLLIEFTCKIICLNICLIKPT